MLSAFGPWIEQNAEGFDVVIENKSEAYGLLAIQGFTPASISLSHIFTIYSGVP